VSYYAGFVDAGFLKAAGAKALGYKPREVRLNAAGTVAWFEAFAQGLPQPHAFLRTYWYDGAFDPADERFASQRRYFDAIASTPGIQLRLGHISKTTPKWQRAVRRAIEECGWDIAEFEQRFTFRPDFSQKGVDTRIALDLVRLGEREAYDMAILLAGDRDLAEAVRAAQDAGRRVVVAVPRGAGFATELRQLADQVLTLEEEDLRTMILPPPDRNDGD
jgi:uncharacterized LabA/DUF88 family protein